jgi:hypothetical protein
MPPRIRPTGDEPDIGAELAMMLEPYRRTSHGSNPWTLTAVRNVAERLAYYRATLDLLGGELTSCYRSVAVNAAVPGSAPTSRHLEGLALDIVPGHSMSPLRAAALVLVEVRARRLGDVAEIIAEPSWLHVGWRRAREAPGTLKLLRLRQRGGAYEPLEPALAGV